MKKTYISLGQRVEKTLQNPYGWKRADFIAEDETCVLILGGNGTTTDKQANGYAKHIDELLRAHNLRKDVKIYSVMYKNDTEGEDYFVPFLLQKTSRDVFFEKHGRNKTLPKTVKLNEYIQKAKTLCGPDIVSAKNPEVSDPEYIERLFEKTILYRISQDGQKLPVEEAKKRIRKLNIVTHCHGAYVFLKLEEMMQQKLKELGYTPKQSADIQKQLLCISYAPYAPLGISKSTMISFASSRDSQIWHHNTFHQQIKNLNKKEAMELSYFPGKLGEVFVAADIAKDEDDKMDHNFPNYVSPNCELTPDGTDILRFSRRALVNAIKSSLSGEPLKDVQTLICGDDLKVKEIFKRAFENGRKTYESMLQNAKICAKIRSRTF